MARRRGTGEPLRWIHPDGVWRRMRCIDCATHHCYWCGYAVLTDVGGSHPLAATREHLKPKGERDQDGGPVVLAHAICNRRRGHAPWVPFHDEGERTQWQKRTRREVRTMIEARL